MRNIILSVSRNKKKIEDFDKKKINSVKKREKCDFCSMDISNDLNLHTDSSELYASCSLCFYAEHIDRVVAMDKGSIVLLPEINQQTLNNLIRLIWFYESNENEKYFDAMDTLMALYEQIKERENFVQSYYADGANDPDVLINTLHNLKLETYNKREIGLHGLLWLPNKDFFEDKIKDWNAFYGQEFGFDNFKSIIEAIKTEVNSEK